MIGKLSASVMRIDGGFEDWKDVKVCACDPRGDAKRAELNVQNIIGVTPLQLVAALGHRDLTELLITHGAEVTCRKPFRKRR